MITATTKTIPAPGIYRGVPFEEYATWEAWNPSLIKVLVSDSPRAMKYVKDNGRSETDAMALGTAVHCAILEPEKFRSRYTVYREGRRAGKAFDAFVEAHVGVEILSESEYDKCLAMQSAARSHARVGPLLAGPGDHELSVVWNHPGTGLLCKSRVDRLARRVVTDAKTTKDPRPHAFMTQGHRLGYHIQMAAQKEGLKQHGIDVDEFHFAAIQSSETWRVFDYQLADNVLREGLDLWRGALYTIKECLESGTWTDPSDETIAYELPAWAAEGEIEGITFGDTETKEA